MAAAKKKNISSWFASSFDFGDAKQSPPTKRRKSNAVESKLSHDLSTIQILSREKGTKNLSSLLRSCEPETASDLVVSKQKQKEIIDWFQYKVKKGHPTALVLSGPSGCGKTVAIRLLARERGFDITEWITPIDQMIDENNRIMRQGEKFEHFVIRAIRYGSLTSQSSGRLLIVKELPNVYYDDKESFCSLLEKYFNMGKEPMVFILTDTGNSKLLQTLFGPKIREKFGIDLINVNAVTATAMKNALKRVSGILNKKASEILDVSQSKIDEILSNSIGDIRSALMNLIFISLKIPEQLSKGGNTIREESLGLLHGIGRVINPKRVQDQDGWKFAHDPDDIASYFQSQATVFLNFVQENYLNTIGSIEDAHVAADLLSISETLNNEWRNDNLNKLTLSFCIRAVMVCNSKPVSGWNPVRKPPSDRIEVKRCLASAEVRSYELIIKPSEKSEQPLLDCGKEGIIE